MTDRYAESKRLYERAARLMPGGVNSPVRAFGSVGGSPLYIARGEGASLIDADGHRYLDFVQSWGPLILGHAHPAVVEAATAALREGLSFGACSAREIKLAELVLAAFPEYERVRFVNSGTEAVMTAIRLARAAVNRPKILKFEGCYHGHADHLLVKAGSGLITQPIATSAGVPAAIAGETLVVPLDDETAVREVFAAHKNQIAAIIVEPLPANSGLLEQRRDYLRFLRQIASEQGALLIFDEVISGLRLRYGGYMHVVGVTPDLVTLGKIVGGGMPVGAICGPARLLDLLAPVGKVYQAGTLSGNPVAMAAGAATLEQLRDGRAYGALDALGRVQDEAFAAIRARRPYFNWRRVGSISWLYLDEGDAPRRPDRVGAKAIERYNRIHRPLLDRGVYLAPSAWEVAFASTAHGEADIRALAHSLDEALDESER
ncbi:MAG: aminotransferase class III-fold pyridoxal phosphate-dependent enzyme [Myxococcales bacterium]|nr:MAG: aminotransferase class III-fold pyridoxal phosphate-dependent enzyme [Myxococcales bacterium]